MKNGTLEGSFHIVGGDFSRSGEAPTELKAILSKVGGIDDSVIRKVAIATFEAEMNIIIYATAGILRYSVSPEEIRIVAEDMGPGIEDLELAMEEGYSTAPDWVREMGWGAGMGLPNMKKNSDIFNIESVVGEGTTVSMVIKLQEDGNA
ncbi:MAG TPA: anti-sigma regulatory factor [Nitrospirae bacterium]|nr:serine/threonine-protein kinase RsbT [bacterium BMS3Abin08]HDO36784.1 anti-sigma regulatory factor [Nitrospirota bacterium]HDY71421.1 anti-sigma regulatory factor [Nitrospirota bacterium]